jgi:Acyl-protein synthetase, LuxE
VTAPLTADLLQFLSLPDADDAAFSAMALRVFAHHFTNNQPFQKFCQQRGKTPRVVRHWHDIPAVPINAFKDLTLSCVAPELCEHVFMTSGTTRGDVKGRHYHPSMVLYDPSMLLNFGQRVMQGRSRIRMAILFPTEQVLPNSSLAHFLGMAIKHFGSADSAYVLSERGLDADHLNQMLSAAEQSGEPIALLGASYSFVHLFDRLEGRSFKLPEGSFVMDTGGFKGQSREMTLDGFYEMLSACLGVPRRRCVNMYGMTELSTQFYDAGNTQTPSVKFGPHWIRTRVVDPVTGRDMPVGAEGILAHTDLANFNSVLSILTEDVGIMRPDGFLLLGRAQGAQAKGCSLAVEEFVQAAQG